ncbi:MAG: hypothetical protein R2909_06030 [Gemmatimonadales bacterium]
MGDPAFVAFFLAVGGMMVALLAGPVGHALARRIGGKDAGAKTGLSTGEMAAERLADVESRLGELEAVQARLLDLEERLDFAERLLVKGSGERVATPAGGSPADG